MGFKSVMGKIGKAALKLAPIAASFIPGLGPIASALIGGGSGAASSALSGGGAKGALTEGLFGAASGYATGKAKGIGPSDSIKYGTPGINPNSGGSSGGWKGALGDIIRNPSPVISAVGEQINSNPRQSNQSSQYGIGPSQAVSRNAGSIMPRGGYGYRDNPMNQLDQSNPNLAQSIFQGRQESIKNQPFRAGYDVTTNIGEPDEEGKFETRVSRMPKIYSTGGRNRRSASM